MFFFKIINSLSLTHRFSGADDGSCSGVRRLATSLISCSHNSPSEVETTNTCDYCRVTWPRTECLKTKRDVSRFCWVFFVHCVTGVLVLFIGSREWFTEHKRRQISFKLAFLWHWRNATTESLPEATMRFGLLCQVIRCQIRSCRSRSGAWVWLCSLRGHKLERKKLHTAEQSCFSDHRGSDWLM